VRHILADIESLSQHNNMLNTNQNAFRPDQCAHCHMSGLWCHGCYTRKADYENSALESLNPIKILRFYCPHCHKTCSVLPECIPPQRHYPWSIQEKVLIAILTGSSYQCTSQKQRPSRWTISRWLRRLHAQFLQHADYLRSQFSSLGRLTSFTECWSSFLSAHPLSKVMVSMNNAGIIIP
jgi:hypothetical protein